MLKILVLTSVLSAACGTRYGYIGNHIVAFEDAPTQTISFTYPKETYQEPKILRNEQPTQDDEITTEVQTTVVPTTKATTTTTIPTTTTTTTTTIPSTTSTTTTTTPKVTTEAQTVETPTTVKPRPSSPGIIWSLVSKVISFVKRIVMKVISVLLSPIFSLSSIPSSFSMSTTKLSSLVTPERLKRAVNFFEMEIKKMQSR